MIITSQTDGRSGPFATEALRALKKHFRIAQEADTTSRFPCTSHPQEIRVPLRPARGIRIGASLEIVESATSAAIDICSSSGLRSCNSKAMRLDRLRELASPPLIRQRKSFCARCVCALASRSLLPPRLLALAPGAPREPRMGESGRGPAAPRSSARNGGRATFFPCWATPRRTRGPRPTAFLAEDKKVSGLPSCAALWPFGLRLRCGSIAPGRSIAVAVAMGAARRETGD